MNEAAAAQEYERAAHYRDLYNTVQLTARDQKVASTGLQDRDTFAMHRVGERVALQVFLMRRGIVVERKEFFWDGIGAVGDEGCAACHAEPEPQAQLTDVRSLGECTACHRNHGIVRPTVAMITTPRGAWPST